MTHIAIAEILDGQVVEAVADEPTAVVAGRWEHEGDTFVIRTRLRGQVEIRTAWAWPSV
jgi:hypothetical protein